MIDVFLFLSLFRAGVRVNLFVCCDSKKLEMNIHRRSTRLTRYTKPSLLKKTHSSSIPLTSKIRKPVSCALNPFLLL